MFEVLTGEMNKSACRSSKPVHVTDLWAEKQLRTVRPADLRNFNTCTVKRCASEQLQLYSCRSEALSGTVM